MKQVISDFIGVATDLSTGVTEAGLRVSPKTTVVASAQSIAFAVHVGLNKKVYSTRVANAPVDLGIDVCGAERRVAAEAVMRAKMAKRRADRIIAKVRVRASLAKIAT
eukprot:6649390-Pyramimonas_sp.AAC.1